MSRAVCMFVSLLLLISICGCMNHTETSSSSMNTLPSTTAVPTVPTTTQFSEVAMPFSTRELVSSVGIDYGYDYYPLPVIINSKEGIVLHLSRLPYPEWTDILAQMDQYNDTFFETCSLIVVWNAPGSSSERHSVKTVTQIAEDEIEIAIEKAIPEAVDDDVVYHLNVIALETKISEKTACNVKYTVVIP